MPNLSPLLLHPSQVVLAQPTISLYPNQNKIQIYLAGQKKAGIHTYFVFKSTEAEKPPQKNKFLEE